MCYVTSGTLYTRLQPFGNDSQVLRQRKWITKKTLQGSMRFKVKPCLRVQRHFTQVCTAQCTLVMPSTMDQISIKAPNPKCRLFLKNYQQRYLTAGVSLSEPPPPVTHCMNTYPCTYSHREGGGEQRSTSEKVRGALVHKRGRKYQHD